MDRDVCSSAVGRSFVIVVSFVSFASCGGRGPMTPSDGEMITGGERFGWEQPAADAGELATFRYAMYVDEARSDAADVLCEAAASGGRFPCSARLPSMPNGAHTLQVAAFVTDAGAVRESPRSAAVRVFKR